MELIGEFFCKLGFKGTPTSITASLMHGGNKNKHAHAHTHTHRWAEEGRAGVRSALRRMRALGFRRRSARTSTLAASQRVHSTPPPTESHSGTTCPTLLPAALPRASRRLRIQDTACRRHDWKKPQAVSRGAEPLTSPNGKLSLQRGCSLPSAWRGGPKHMEGKTHTHTNHAQLLKASRSSRENFSISVYVSIASFPFQRGLSLSPASGSSSVGMFAGRRAECYIKQTIKRCYTA